MPGLWPQPCPLAALLAVSFLADWGVVAVPFPHLKLRNATPYRSVTLYESAVTVWSCDSTSEIVRELCEVTAMKHRLSMDHWRALWGPHDCEARIQGGWIFPWPCYYDMWRHYWEERLNIAVVCWAQETLNWCVITAVAIVLAMLKQGNLWDEAEGLFKVCEQMGITGLTQWPSVYQTAWFVPMRPDASPSIYVPGGIGRMDEPVSPHSFGHVSMDNGFFDPYTSNAIRPIAEALLPNWDTITAEWMSSEVRSELGGPQKAWDTGMWSRYEPGVVGSGVQNWWEMGKASLTTSIRLWGGYPGNNDTWWNFEECRRISSTLCQQLMKTMPTTARPVPQYVLDTSSRWEHIDLKRILPGANQAMHPDPCRCLWQICLEGCEGAYLQVGKIVREYQQGVMFAIDATFEHTVWVREENTVTRTVLHGVIHYCNGTYAE